MSETKSQIKGHPGFMPFWNSGQTTQDQEKKEKESQDGGDKR